ncbi:hypothetical protein Bbelb_319950 [Branchiostoma belcheri]|nr:hypothetical protein Bbelb_319950 [Branchiostoma belcheri]
MGRARSGYGSLVAAAACLCSVLTTTRGVGWNLQHVHVPGGVEKRLCGSVILTGTAVSSGLGTGQSFSRGGCAPGPLKLDSGEGICDFNSRLIGMHEALVTPRSCSLQSTEWHRALTVLPAGWVVPAEVRRYRKKPMLCQLVKRNA